MVLAPTLTPAQHVTTSAHAGLGHRLKALRLRARLSQQTVTIQVLGEPSKFWLSNIETGRATLPHDVAPKLASALGVSVECLLGLDSSLDNYCAVRHGTPGTNRGHRRYWWYWRWRGWRSCSHPGRGGSIDAYQ